VVLSGIFQLHWGFQVAPTFTAASARPYTLFSGTNLNGDGRYVDRVIDPSTGQMLRPNSERGDPFSLLDVRVTKKIPAGPRLTFDVFAEVFNVFNAANFGNNYNGFAPSPLFKQPVALMIDVGYSRRMQLGGRVTF